MPSWKKILQSGSAVHVLNITASSLPNSLQPNIIGYNTASGRFTFFSTSSLVSGGSIIGGSGLTNYIPKWSNSTTLTSSIIFDNGTNVGIGTTSPTAKLQVLDSFTVSASSGQFADVKFRLLTQSYKNHVLTYDETTGQIYYFSSSLEETVPTCYTPTIIAGPQGTIESCPNVPVAMAAYSSVNNHINNLTYQWYISGSQGTNPTPITNATGSVFFTTGSGFFSVRICDGACCDTLYDFLQIIRTPTGSITLDSGNNIQSQHALSPITPIHYTTTGNITSLNLLNAPPGINLTVTPNSITMSGVLSLLPGNVLTTFNYVIQQLNGCFPTILGNQTPVQVSGSITVQPANIYTISGSFKYDNTSETPMNNSKVILYTTGSNLKVQEAETDTDGNYTMDIGSCKAFGTQPANQPLPIGEYYLVGATTKPWGGVNSVDALGIARHFTGAAPLVGLRLKAADVNGSNTINSLDALTTSRRFSGLVSSFTPGNWAYETQSVVWDATAPINKNLKALAYGDINRSYQPNTAL